MVMRILLGFTFVLAITACAPAKDIQAHEFDIGFDIEIQSTSDAPNIKDRKQAERVCATRGEGAKFRSSHPPTGSMYLYVHKYTCLPTRLDHAKMDRAMSNDTPSENGAEQLAFRAFGSAPAYPRPSLEMTARFRDY